MGRERSFLSVTHAPCSPACLNHHTAPYIPRPSMLQLLAHACCQEDKGPRRTCPATGATCGPGVQKLGCTVVKQDEWMVEVRHAHLLGLEHVDVGGDALRVLPCPTPCARSRLAGTSTFCLRMHALTFFTHPVLHPRLFHNPVAPTHCSRPCLPGNIMHCMHAPGISFLGSSEQYPNHSLGQACQANSSLVAESTKPTRTAAPGGSVLWLHLQHVRRQAHDLRHDAIQRHAQRQAQHLPALAGTCRLMRVSSRTTVV